MVKIAGVVLCALAIGVSGFRARTRSRSNKEQYVGKWSTVTDASHGVCAENIKHVGNSKPVHIPLLCTAPAQNVTMSFAGWGHLFDKVWFAVNGVPKGELSAPFFGGDLYWSVPLGNLRSGIHTLKFWGAARIGAVKIEGTGVIPCSMDSAPNYTRTGDSATYGGFDSLNNLFGQKGLKFSEFKKRQAYFAEESLGRNEDGSISSAVVQEGLWYWLYEISQNPSPNDPLGNESASEHGLWNESLIKPWRSIPLGNMRGRSGQSSKVIEPCNTLSSLTYNEVTVWISCKGYHFTRDEMASLITAFNALSAGTAFNHFTGTQIGGHVDVFAMAWLLLQQYQIMTRSVIEQAGDRLTEAEVKAVETFGYGVGKVTDLSKQMTRLFSEKYDREFWEATTRAVDIPDYMKSITGLIVFALYGVEGALPIPGLSWALNSLVTGLLDMFDVPDKQFFINTYIPAARKALSFSRMCTDAVVPVMNHILKFVIVFVEALIYQEQTLNPPQILKDVLAWADNLGITGDLLSDMVRTWDYYNGENCIARSDHANWHEKAAHGLIHFTTVAELFLTKHNC